MNSQEAYDEELQPRGWLGRIKDRLTGNFEYVDSEAVVTDAAPDSRRRAAIRLESSRPIHVDVRLKLTTMDDAQIAADGIKDGLQQIINLEHADSASAQRLLDFLNGVIYALDGSVEKIGEKVYLCAPANVQIDVDAGKPAESSARRTSVF